MSDSRTYRRTELAKKTAITTTATQASAKTADTTPNPRGDGFLTIIFHFSLPIVM